MSQGNVLIINALIHQGGFKKAQLLLLLIGSLFFSALGYGAIVVEVSTAAVEVADQGQSTTERAMREALSRVFVKMSGTQSVLDDTEVRQAVRAAEQYLRAYRFSFEQGKIFYVAEFDEDRIADILRAQNLSIWESRRPETLFWLAVEEESERSLVGHSSQFSYAGVIENTADYRGLPIQLPDISESDDNTALIYDVWGRFGSRIKSASTIYAADTIIAARLYPNVAAQVTIVDQNNSELDSTSDASDEQLSANDAERLLEQALSQASHSNDTDVAPSVDNFNEQQTNDTELTSLDELLDQILSEQDGNETIVEESSGKSLPTFLDGVDYSDSDIQAYESELPEQSDSAFSSEEFDYYAQRNTSGDYAFDFMIISQAGITEGKMYGNSPDQMIERFVNQYADDIAVQYTVSHAEADITRSSLSISVANINSIENYAGILDYLSTFSLIESVMLTQQQGSVATFNIVLLGNAEDFVATVLLDSQLVPVNQSAEQEALQQAFYWNP